MKKLKEQTEIRKIIARLLKEYRDFCINYDFDWFEDDDTLVSIDAFITSLSDETENSELDKLETIIRKLAKEVI